MSNPVVTVVIPTLTAGAKLEECVRSLMLQSRRNLEIVVVDNSGDGAVDRTSISNQVHRVIKNARNLGFGAAINQGWARSHAPYLAVLNDDAVVSPAWIGALVSAMESAPEVGMCASRVEIAGAGKLDSAGMLMCGDGASKQRGQGLHPRVADGALEALFPSGSAALYRRTMLEEIGGFDESFFLYCEDTDLGLRARWAGWRCRYAPEAVVEHHYSVSAGRASPLKAYLVERNRLFVIAKNFPVRMLVRVPLFAVARYLWHLRSIVSGRGAAAEFRNEGNHPARLLWYVIRSHLAVVAAGVRLFRQRRAIRRTAKLTASQFQTLLDIHWISPREVAAL